jgi:hypothetical protein
MLKRGWFPITCPLGQKHKFDGKLDCFVGLYAPAGATRGEFDQSTGNGDSEGTHDFSPVLRGARLENGTGAPK